MSAFYPNVCYLCKVASPLRRCRRCNMISYCGEEHQLDHMPDHMQICKVIYSILKEQNLNHIFEGKTNCDVVQWQREKVKMVFEVSQKLGRSLSCFEREMILYPRVCFVCHEANQDLLKNCPRCPNTSFCEKHPESPIHDEDCPRFQECLKIDIEYEALICSFNMNSLNRAIINATPIFKLKSKVSHKPLNEYLECIERQLQLSDIMKMYLADFLSLPLSTFDVLQKVKTFSLSKLIVHIHSTNIKFEHLKGWEILFHLIPSLSQLNIVVFECQDFFKLQNRLCEKCHMSKKKLNIEGMAMTYLDYLNLRNYEKPGIVLLLYLSPPEKKNILESSQKLWKLSLVTWGSVSCPLVLFSDTEKQGELLRESVQESFKEVKIFYDGQNEFASPRYTRNWENERIYRQNSHVLIMKVAQPDEVQTCYRCGKTCRTVNSKGSNCARCEMDLLSLDVALFPKRNKNGLRHCFYVNCCQLCRNFLHDSTLLMYSPLPCEKCKMVFYCRKSHQREHWPKHKDLCNVICNMLDESGSSNLFDKADKSSNEAWLQAKINVLLTAQKKLGRNLLDDEKEMFLFPKTCFSCHRGYPVPLKTCKCSISCCSDCDFEEHKKYCVEFYFTFQCDDKFLSIRQSPSPISVVEKFLCATRTETFKQIPLRQEGEKLPNSMDAVIEPCIAICNKVFWESCNPDKLLNTREMLYAEIFSRPLTVLEVLQGTQWTLDSMMIHVIGAIDDEKSEAGYWELLLHLLPCVKNLKITFVGPEVSELQLMEVAVCQGCSEKEKKLEVESFSLRYDEYFKTESFIVPHIIIGFNLHIHESDYGITEDTWKETILTLTKIPAPFVMTAKTYIKAMKDCKKLEMFFGHPIDYAYFGLNEFRAVIPRRDYEVEKYEVSNQFIVFFKLFEIRLPTSATDKKSQDGSE